MRIEVANASDRGGHTSMLYDGDSSSVPEELVRHLGACLAASTTATHNTGSAKTALNIDVVGLQV